MAKANGYKTAGIVANVLPLAKEIKAALVPALQKAGIEVKVNEEYPPDIKDMTAMLSKVKAAAPRAVLVLSYPSDSVLYAKQAKELGIAAPFQFVAVGPTIDFYPKAVGAAANGFVTMGHWSPAQAAWKRAKPFHDAYVKKFNEKPDYLDTVLAYMSCEILEQAVAKAGLDREKLRQAISTMTFDTINGPVRFQGVQNSIPDRVPADPGSRAAADLAQEHRHQHVQAENGLVTRTGLRWMRSSPASSRRRRSSRVRSTR
jgi:branched-chain amino acid transport system substrate-binding protein